MSSIFGSPAKSQTSSTQTSQNSAVNGSETQGAQGSDNSSTSSSSQYNQAYPMLSQALGGQVQNGTGASNNLAALLGVGGNPAAQQAAFQNWRDNTGYQFGLDQGTQAINGSAAARGMLNSGSTAKALEAYGQNYANTQYQNYLNPLMGLINSGNQAGQIIGGVGGMSNSNSQSNGTSFGFNNGSSFGSSNGSSNATSTGTSTGATPGIGGMLGSLATAVATGGSSIPMQAAKAGSQMLGGGNGGSGFMENIGGGA